MRFAHRSSGSNPCNATGTRQRINWENSDAFHKSTWGNVIHRRCKSQEMHFQKLSAGEEAKRSNSDVLRQANSSPNGDHPFCAPQTNVIHMVNEKQLHHVRRPKPKRRRAYMVLFLSSWRKIIVGLRHNRYWHGIPTGDSSWRHFAYTFLKWSNHNAISSATENPGQERPLRRCAK